MKVLELAGRPIRGCVEGRALCPRAKRAGIRSPAKRQEMGPLRRGDWVPCEEAGDGSPAKRQGMGPLRRGRGWAPCEEAGDGCPLARGLSPRASGQDGAGADVDRLSGLASYARLILSRHVLGKRVKNLATNIVTPEGDQGSSGAAEAT